jgi:beta-galactosidase/beta-glucuronidase
MTEQVSRSRLDLSGTWQLAFDPEGEGVRRGWTGERFPEADAHAVQVPALWTMTHPDVDGVGFYRRVLTVPPGWQGKALRLHVDGASYRAEAWLNGAYLGSHEGAYTPFCFDVTPFARYGDDNRLVVRVAGLSKAADVDGMAIAQSPAS